MGENTKIEWAHHTFNPWIGCTKVSPGCDNCYAERDMDLRFGRVEWGAGKPRSRTSPANWQKPIRWNRDASGHGIHRQRVFCASLADVFDTEVDDQWRHDLFDLIKVTRNLDWLLLTKRPAYARRWRALHGQFPFNVWIGTTVENQDVYGARLNQLWDFAGENVRFLSVEPMLGPLSLRDGLLADGMLPEWVICGGESGRNVRQLDAEWARDLRDQCETEDIPFLMKQMSGNLAIEREAIPADLLVRQYPHRAYWDITHGR